MKNSKEIQAISQTQLINLISKAVEKAHFFSVSFIKQDYTVRNMNSGKNTSKFIYTDLTDKQKESNMKRKYTLASQKMIQVIDLQLLHSLLKAYKNGDIKKESIQPYRIISLLKVFSLRYAGKEFITIPDCNLDIIKNEAPFIHKILMQNMK